MMKIRTPRDTDGQGAGSIALRFFGYTLVILLLNASLPLLAREGGLGSFILEEAFIERAQLALLIATAGVFVSGARSLPRFRRLLLILAAFPSFAVVRGLDFVLSSVPVLGWKIGWILLLGAGIVAHRHRDELLSQLAGFATSRSFALLWAGFVLAIPIAQLVGHGPLLEEVMGAEYSRPYKRLIEELLEAEGYLVLLFGAIETRIELAARVPAWRMLAASMDVGREPGHRVGRGAQPVRD